MRGEYIKKIRLWSGGEVSHAKRPQQQHSFALLLWKYLDFHDSRLVFVNDCNVFSH